MNRGILFATTTALFLGNLGAGCKPSSGPEHLSAVDSMLTTVEAALLTLNELDRERYTRATAQYQADAERFKERFRDTLDRATAERLGNHFRMLRAAEVMGNDHDRLVSELKMTKERLRALRRDLESGTVPSAEADRNCSAERAASANLAEHVDAVIANYRTIQRAWEERDTVETMMADTNHKAKVTSR